MNLAQPPESGSKAQSVTDRSSPAPSALQGSYSRIETLAEPPTIALATAAHELKTPLSIIKGYIELLLSEKVGRLSERQRQILDDSLQNCNRLQKFVQDLLAYGTLEAGKIHLEPRLGDLNTCLTELCSFWLDKFSAKGIALFSSINSELEPFEFDYYKVQQVISNLLENALKFTSKGGTVWLTAEPYKLERRVLRNPSPIPERRKSAPFQTNAVRVIVADTGVGIAPEYHQEIFDDFFKVPTETCGSEGTGLGLAIARRLVQAHGGKIWAESELGIGTKFSVVLPLKIT